MKKQNSLSERFRLFEAIIWMNSLGLIFQIIKGISPLKTNISEEAKELCKDEIEKDIIKLLVLTGVILILLFAINHIKWEMITGPALLVLSLLGELKRFTVHLLNVYYGDWPPHIGAFLLIKNNQKKTSHFCEAYIFI